MNELLATPPLHTSSWLSKSEDFTISKTQLDSNGLLYSGAAPLRILII